MILKGRFASAARHKNFTTYLTVITNTMVSMMSTVFRGLTPAAVKPAYDSAPNTPAAPVPDDHVETTLLHDAKCCTHWTFCNRLSRGSACCEHCSSEGCAKQRRHNKFDWLQEQDDFKWLWSCHTLEIHEVHWTGFYRRKRFWKTQTCEKKMLNWGRLFLPNPTRHLRVLHLQPNKRINVSVAVIVLAVVRRNAGNGSLFSRFCFALTQ